MRFRTSFRNHGEGGKGEHVGFGPGPARLSLKPSQSPSGTALVLLLPVVACEQQSLAPSVDASPVFAAASLDKNSVLRYQDHLATSWTDATSGLRATHTTFPIPFGNRPETDCGPQADLATIDFKQIGVVDPVDVFTSELHLNASGPVWVIVRDMNQPGDCYGVKLIAEGPGEIRYVDNDAFGVAPGEFAKNEWGYSAKGSLTTPDGQVLAYKGFAHYTVKADGGEPAFTRILEQVSLQ